MKKPDQQRIHGELVKLCAAIPKVLTAIVVSIDGQLLSFHSKNDTFDEQQLAILGAIFFSVGERVAADLHVGGWRYYIAAGSTGLAIYIPIGSSDYSLILIIPSDTAPDDLWPSLEPQFKSLATYFEVN